MKYVSLHHHTCFSYMDGHRLPAAHVERVADLGMSAMALTEHGNVSSHPQLEKAAGKFGIKPIYGLEAYTATEPTSRRKFHMTILAMNAEGYRNLMKIVTASWQNFYQWPTVSGRILAENHEGLIVLSGCADSLLACTLLGGKTIDPADASYARAKVQALKFKELLGDRFYLEAQMFPELERSRDINSAYEQLARDTRIPLVATADCHYPHPDDNEMQVILHAAGRGAGSVAAQEATWEYDIRLAPPASDSVVIERLRGTGLSARSASAALAATAEIADRCTVVLPKAERLRYPVAPGQTSLELVWEWLRKGWHYRVAQGNKRMVALREEYVQRIRYEMDLISAKDFVDYFLMLADIVSYSKDAGIPVGPARGSAAASLVCYLLRITEIDPLAYPLMMFERFIAPDRMDTPDIDLDFDDELRYLVKERAAEVFGADRVGNLANYTRYRGKSAIDDVARVNGIPRSSTEELKGMILERSGGDSRADAALGDTIEAFPRAQEIIAQFPALAKAIRLEGDYRGMGVHAAGLIIAASPITDICALYTKTRKASGGRPESTVSVVSVDKKDAEYLGMLKADFLGLSTMGMIRHALEIAGLTLEELYRVPMDDTETLEAFRRNDVVGIFQFEGRATRVINRNVKPDNFMEIADINALSRPGPLFSGTTTEYIRVKWGEIEPTSFHPIVDKLTAATKGQIIYQEQVLESLRLVGGLPVTRVGEIRRIISQKLGEAQFNESMGEFCDNAQRDHGLTREAAELLWSRLVTSATYSFCCTGDTVVERGGAGRYAQIPQITIAELYAAQESKTPIGDKMRYGRGVKILQMSDDGRVRPARLIRIHAPVIRPVVRIRTAAGREFRCSIEHNVLTPEGYRCISELSPGDKLIAALPKEAPPHRGPNHHAAGGTWDGMQGSGNPGWIDGRSVNLRQAKNEVLGRSGGACEHCGLKSSVATAGAGGGHDLEFAHIVPLTDLDGDYALFHRPDNILHLCNSCHKRFDYGKGERVVRWTRGRPTGADPIVSIEPAGEDMVYDVSMEGPAHNYVGNGVVHHNNVAHCVSYAMLAFWCMWLKVHHPIAFYTAQLRKTDKKLWPRLIKDAQAHGVPVRGVTPGKSAGDWVAGEDGAIYAGWGQLHGVGEVLQTRILEFLAGGGNTERPEDLLAVKGIGPAMLAKFRDQLGSEDPFGLQRVARSLAAVAADMRTGEIPIPAPEYGSDEILDLPGGRHLTWMGFVRLKEFKDFIEDQRSRYGKTLEEIRREMKKPHLKTYCVLHCYDDKDEDVYVRITRFAYPKFREALEQIRPDRDIVWVRAMKSKAGFGASIYVENLVVIDPDS